MRLQRHYLYAEPGLALPLLALALNIVFIMVLTVYVRGLRGNLRVGFTPDAATRPAPLREPIVLTARAENDIQLDNEFISNLDRLSKVLEMRSGSGQSIVLRTPESLKGTELAKILQVCAKSGFANVYLQPASEHRK